MNVLERLESKDGSIKFLLQLQDCNTIETLYMKDKREMLTYNNTVCISSQVGCKVGCMFCATGKQGFVRNLSASEIIGQVDMCKSYCNQIAATALNAVVFAGMGEPLLNYENVKVAIKKLNAGYGINNFELATVGIVPSIHKMISDFRNENIIIRLNFSLHASTDAVRARLIPFNSHYNISEILEAALQYAEAFGSKVRIRYMLIKGLNDTELDIARLCRLLESKPLKLILSSYNDNNINGLTAADKDDVQAFYTRIKDRIESDIFFNFGRDILGGCGQLRQLQSAYTTKERLEIH